MKSRAVGTKIIMAIIVVTILMMIAAFSASAARNEFFVDLDGNLWASGANDFGQLGNGTTMDNFNEMTLVLTGVRSARRGLDTGFAIKEDGTLWAWGRNNFGQLGDGTTVNRHTPVKIMDGVSDVSTGAHLRVGTLYQTFAIREDGTLWAWGRNDFGQLGDGTTVNRHAPVEIMDGLATDGWERVVPTLYYTFAIREDGTLWAWGRNDFGQLGDGTTVNRYRPTRILSNVQAVLALSDSTVASLFDGGSLEWGAVVFGRYNDNAVPQGSLIPIPSFRDRSVRLCINKRIMSPTVPPRLVNGRVLVPIRLISEELGATVVWNSETNVITITKDETTITMNIDSPYPLVDGQRVLLEQPPIMVMERVLVPLRFIAEAFGAIVQWDGSDWVVTISTS